MALQKSVPIPSAEYFVEIHSVPPPFGRARQFFTVNALKVLCPQQKRLIAALDHEQHDEAQRENVCFGRDPGRSLSAPSRRHFGRCPARSAPVMVHRNAVTLAANVRADAFHQIVVDELPSRRRRAEHNILGLHIKMNALRAVDPGQLLRDLLCEHSQRTLPGTVQLNHSGAAPPSDREALRRQFVSESLHYHSQLTLLCVVVNAVDFEQFGLRREAIASREALRSVRRNEDDFGREPLRWSSLSMSEIGETARFTKHFGGGGGSSQRLIDLSLRSMPDLSGQSPRCIKVPERAHWD